MKILCNTISERMIDQRPLATQENDTKLGQPIFHQLVFDWRKRVIPTAEPLNQFAFDLRYLAHSGHI